ncbi:MAG: hypothetical protein QM758_29345 [Armatimonas sp.]
MRRDRPGEFESRYLGYLYYSKIDLESKQKILSIITGYSIFSGFSTEDEEGYIYINSDFRDPDLYLRDRLLLLLSTGFFTDGNISRISFDYRWWEDFHVECELILIKNGTIEIVGGDISKFLQENRQIFHIPPGDS